MRKTKIAMMVITAVIMTLAVTGGLIIEGKNKAKNALDIIIETGVDGGGL